MGGGDKPKGYLERRGQLPGFPSPAFLREAFSGGDIDIPKLDLQAMVEAPEESLKLINAGRKKDEPKMKKKELLSLVVGYRNCDLELLEGILDKYFDLIPDVILDSIVERIKSPNSFLKGRRSRYRTEFIEKLTKMLAKFKPDTGPTLDGILGFDMPVFFNKNKKLAKTLRDLQVFNKFLQTGKNPLYENYRGFDELMALPFFDLKLCMSYGWIIQSELVGKYASFGSVEGLWEEKTTNRKLHSSKNRARLRQIGKGAVEFSKDKKKLDKEPKEFDDLRRVIAKKIAEMDKRVKGPNDLKDLELGSLRDYVGVDYFIAIMTKELLGTGEKRFRVDEKKHVTRELTPKARVELINMILKDPDVQLTLIPALNDRQVSFGAYQTVERTFNDVVDTMPIAVPTFDKCMSFSDQTDVVVWLTYKNLRSVEQALFRECESDYVLKNRRKIFKSATKKELRDFYYHMAAVAHNKGRSFVRGAILKFKDKTFAKHGESSAFQVFRNYVYGELGSDGNGYGKDVKEISDSLIKGRELYAKK